MGVVLLASILIKSPVVNNPMSVHAEAIGSGNPGPSWVSDWMDGVDRLMGGWVGGIGISKKR